MTVYVRWYGKVLEGELLDGESMGMKHVRIPLDGHHSIALFMPDHVYDSPDQVMGNSPIISPIIPQSFPELPDNNQKPADSKVEMVHLTEVAYWGADTPTNDCQSIEAFKQANWDHERNHLRIDMLDEFYQLWRKVIAPSGFADMEQNQPEIEQNKVELEQKPVRVETKSSKPKPSKKMLRSTGQQQFTDSKQLSLFD